MYILQCQATNSIYTDTEEFNDNYGITIVTYQRLCVKTSLVH